jgi:hypothetical protein
MLPSQSPKPREQLERRHVPAEQVARALGKLHTMPQPPQWEALLWMSTSQPLLMSPSQSAVPATQRVLHTPAEHSGVVPMGPVQVLPQVPQARSEERRFSSQPSAGLLLQSAKPGLQVKVQRPALHDADALRGAGQRMLQAPQCIGSLERFVSQPLAALPSQLPKPMSQRGTVQAPATHAGSPLGGSHTAPQRPQCGTLVCVSTQSPWQHERPPAQSALVVQPPSGGAVSGGAVSGGAVSGGATMSSGGAVSGGAVSGGAVSGGATMSSGGAVSGMGLASGREVSLRSSMEASTTRR